MHNVMPFIVGMVVTMAWLPVLVRLASKWLIMDHPGERKVHTTPIPRVGGVAMALGVVVAALLTIPMQREDIWFLIAAGVLVCFGVLDDRFDLDYRIKLIGQLLAVNIVILAGDVRVQSIALDERFWLPGWISMPLTVFFLVGITNAINLADGLDGLAGGTTFLCLCAVALLSSAGSAGSPTAFAMAFAGAVLGFLRFNTYPATLFMGDAGSQLLGFSVGVLGIRATQDISSDISAAIPILLLALPILDTLSVMVQRISEGRSPFSADKNHIHHKLLAMGFDHNEAVMVIYAIQACLFLVAYFMRFESDLLILMVVTVFFLVSIAAFQGAARSGWRIRNRSQNQVEPMVPRLFTLLRQPKMLPRISYIVIASAIAVYALLVVSEAVTLREDFRALILGMLAIVIVMSAILRVAPLSVVEKAALYVTAALLVYLDATQAPTGKLYSNVGWTAIAIAGIGTAVRLRLFTDRRFQLTPLDLIVFFMALVVPSLPGILELPQGGALAIAKLMVLFYALEMLVSRSEDRAIWLRAAAACVLAGLAMRPLLPF